MFGRRRGDKFPRCRQVLFFYSAYCIPILTLLYLQFTAVRRLHMCNNSNAYRRSFDSGEKVGRLSGDLVAQMHSSALGALGSWLMTTYLHYASHFSFRHDLWSPRPPPIQCILQRVVDSFVNRTERHRERIRGGQLVNKSALRLSPNGRASRLCHDKHVDNKKPGQ